MVSDNRSSLVATNNLRKIFLENYKSPSPNRKDFEDDESYGKALEEHSKQYENFLKEYEQGLYFFQELDSKDAKDFGPSFLEGIQGSLAEERRQSSQNKQKYYNRKVRQARRLLKQVSMQDILKNPNLLDIKLSEIWARYPSTSSRLEFNIQELTKSNSKLLRAFLIYWYQLEEVPSWIKYLVEEQLDLILKPGSFYSNSKIFKQNLLIRQTFLVLGKNLGVKILEAVYSEENLRRWNRTGESLTKNYQAVKIPYMNLKEKVRRRGYRESHSNKNKSRDERLKVMASIENQELEEIRQRILLKQALLFEQRLDTYLQLQREDIPKAKRRELFNDLLKPEPEKEAESQENITNPEEE